MLIKELMPQILDDFHRDQSQSIFKTIIGTQADFSTEPLNKHE